MTLLEREDDLRLVDETLSAGRDHVGGLLVVRGVPGAGKTALLREAVRRGADAGMTVLRARGSRLEQPFAWGTVHALLARTSRARDGAALLASPVLAPAMPRPGGHRGTSAAQARHALAHGLYWHVADLADAAPLALVVDDAHWADDASLAFLVHLAGRLEGLPVALVVAARHHAEGAQGALLADLEATPGTRRCTPAPLSAAGTRAYVAERLGPEAADALAAPCHAGAGGNPFLTVELVGELQRQGVPADERGAALVAGLRPENVDRAVRGRLRALSPGAIALAHAVAILGLRPETHIAARVAGLDLVEATGHADALAMAGILCPGRPLDFVHPLVEASIRDAIPVGQAAIAHRRAFDALTADGADARTTAPHLLRAEPSGDPAAVAILRRVAAGSMEHGDPATATSLLRRAVRESAAAAGSPELLEELGRAELAAGDDAGVAHLERARAASTDPRRRASLALAIATARYDHGDPRGAQDALAEGLREPLGDDDAVRVSLLAADLTARRSLVDPDQAVAEHAVAETLRRHGVPRTPVERLTLAHLAFRGLQTAALPHERVVEIARRALPPADPAEVGELDELALPLAGMCLYFSDASREGEDAFTAAIGRAQARGARIPFATASFFRGASRYLQGRLLDAAADYDLALDAVEDGWAHSLPSCRAMRALVALERDEAAQATELLELPGGDGRWEAHPTYPYVLCVRGVLATDAGRPDEGLELLLRAGRRQEELGIHNPAVLHWWSEAACSALASGRPDVARRLADELDARAARYGGRRLAGIARRTAAHVRDGDEALDLLDDAVTALEGSEARLELARALLDLGSAQRRAGLRTTARETLRRAVDVAGACGSTVLAARGTDELRVAGGRPRRTRTSGADALTSGERRVAQLAGQGLSNREIAQRLFVTRRTVETHLTHVYGKLGVGREALAAALGPDDDGP